VARTQDICRQMGYGQNAPGTQDGAQGGTAQLVNRSLGNGAVESRPGLEQQLLVALQQSTQAEGDLRSQMADLHRKMDALAMQQQPLSPNALTDKETTFAECIADKIFSSLASIPGQAGAADAEAIQRATELEEELANARKETSEVRAAAQGLVTQMKSYITDRGDDMTSILVHPNVASNIVELSKRDREEMGGGAPNAADPDIKAQGATQLKLCRAKTQKIRTIAKEVVVELQSCINFKRRCSDWIGSPTRGNNEEDQRTVECIRELEEARAEGNADEQIAQQIANAAAAGYGGGMVAMTHRIADWSARLEQATQSHTSEELDGDEDHASVDEEVQAAVEDMSAADIEEALLLAEAEQKVVCRAIVMLITRMKAFLWDRETTQQEDGYSGFMGDGPNEYFENEQRAGMQEDDHGGFAGDGLQEFFEEDEPPLRMQELDERDRDATVVSETVTQVEKVVIASAETVGQDISLPIAPLPSGAGHARALSVPTSWAASASAANEYAIGTEPAELQPSSSLPVAGLVMAQESLQEDLLRNETASFGLQSLEGSLSHENYPSVPAPILSPSFDEPGSFRQDGNRDNA